MKRVAILVAVLTLVATGLSFAGTKPAADCTCERGAQSMTLGLHELTP